MEVLKAVAAVEEEATVSVAGVKSVVAERVKGAVGVVVLVL